MLRMSDVTSRLSTALADRYRIERELGEGGMATVYLAEDLKHDRKVAVKVLKAELAAALGAERFEQEITTTANLQHPHILPLFDSGEADGFLYYVMPFIDGETLRDKLDRETQLSIDEAVQITTDIADALDYAHRHNVIHRDIKPEYILLHEGKPLVADFGIALAVSRVTPHRITATGVSLGTPSYMSPEQAAGNREVTARADVYALAAVLYEMLSGDPPFTGNNVQAVHAKVLTERPARIRKIRDTVPSYLDAAIDKALAKVPADRFDTASKFADALSGKSRTGPIWMSRASSRRRLMAIAGVAVLIAATYGLVRLNRDGGSPVALLRPSFNRVTAEPGIEWFPSLSPDGQWIVYSGDGSGNRDIYLKSVGGQNPINLTSDSPADDDQPAFSADGQRIAFRSSRDGGGIFVMGRTGEAVRRVTRGGFKPSWSPDGTQLAYVTENVEVNPQSANTFSQLWIVGVDAGEPRRLDVLDAVMQSWSPNGHSIAYTTRLGELAQTNIWTVSASGGEPVAATNDVAIDWYPAWSPEGDYLYFVSDRGGSMNLWRMPIDEESGVPRGDPEPITTPATALAHISVATDGGSIAYSSVLITANIQKHSLDPELGQMIGTPTWVTTGSRLWSSPDPSPDGQRVAFYSLSQPQGNIYLANVDGSGLRQVTGDSDDRVPRWSPNGDWMAFLSTRGGPFELWRVRPDGSELRQLTQVRTANVPVWSPDGLRMVASASRGDRRATLVFDPYQPWEAQDPLELPSPDDAFATFAINSWSPDGEHLAGQHQFTDAGIIVYTFRTGLYEGLTDFGEWPVWLPDNRRLLFVTGGNEFHIVDRISKDVRRIFSVGSEVIGPPRFSSDGRQVYYSRRVTEADVWLLTLP